MKAKSKKENFVMPEKWYVKGCKELSEYFSEFGLNNRSRKQRSDILYSLGGDCKDKYYFMIEYPSWDFSKKTNGIEITLEQFKEHVLKEKESEFNSTAEFEGPIERLNQKQIIGYKLVKQEYKEAVKTIINNNDWFHNFEINIEKSGYNFACMDEKDPMFWASVHSNVKKAGVLDLWFEPVYKPEIITLKTGVELSESDIDEVRGILIDRYAKL